MLDDAAARRKVRRTESAVHRLQDGVAVGAIHEHFELRLKGDSITRVRESEIRDRGFTADIDRRECAFEQA